MTNREAIEILGELKKCYLGGIVDAIDMAIEAVKAQEPVKPVVDVDTWKCGNCEHILEHQELLGDNVLFHEQYSYCPNCGRPVNEVGMIYEMTYDKGLKPCPFCGASPKLNHLKYDMLPWHMYHVSCPECTAEIKDVSATEAEAVAAWNRRVNR